MKLSIADVLLPREVAFFGYMNEQVDVFCDACKTFKGIIDHIERMPENEMREKVTQIKSLELKGDNIERHIIDELDKTFITPLDREDIQSIAMNVDRCLDQLNSVSQRLEIYKIRKRPQNIIKLASIIVEISQELRTLVALLEKKEGANSIIRRIDTLEKESDHLFHTGLAELFEGKDAVEIIKFKEIYECLEDVVDIVHHISKLINVILVKHG